MDPRTHGASMARCPPSWTLRSDAVAGSTAHALRLRPPPAFERAGARPNQIRGAQTPYAEGRQADDNPVAFQNLSHPPSMSSTLIFGDPAADLLSPSTTFPTDPAALASDDALPPHSAQPFVLPSSHAESSSRAASAHDGAVAIQAGLSWRCMRTTSACRSGARARLCPIAWPDAARAQEAETGCVLSQATS